MSLSRLGRGVPGAPGLTSCLCPVCCAQMDVGWMVGQGSDGGA